VSEVGGELKAPQLNEGRRREVGCEFDLHNLANLVSDFLLFSHLNPAESQRFFLQIKLHHHLHTKTQTPSRLPLDLTPKIAKMNRKI
jgi:hypothetical protein